MQFESNLSNDWDSGESNCISQKSMGKAPFYTEMLDFLITFKYHIIVDGLDIVSLFV